MVDRACKGGPDGERGQGLLEFALVVVFLLIVMFGIIDFARIFFGYATMSNGVREGAHYAVVHPVDPTGAEGCGPGHDGRDRGAGESGGRLPGQVRRWQFFSARTGAAGWW